jgi:hypothetical protein
MQRNLRSIALICGVLSLSSCWPNTAPIGSQRHDSRSVELDSSERVRVELNMRFGELNVRGGAQKLLDADFTYNMAAWKPDLRYRSGAGIGDLTVEQHGSTTSRGDSTNRWDLRFNDNLPLDLNVQLGAGEGRLDLGSLRLSSVDIQMGAGTLRLDLRGAPKKDYSVHVRGGVGEATVYLPNDIGISATASGGIGDISVTGLRKSGDRYVNDAEARSGVRIRLDIQGGVGSIKLIAE